MLDRDRSSTASIPILRADRLLAAGTGVLIGSHIQDIFALALQSPVLHSVQHFSFVFAGSLFLVSVLQPWPAEAFQSRWLILLYLFLVTLPCDILSAYLSCS